MSSVPEPPISREVMARAQQQVRDASGRLAQLPRVGDQVHTGVNLLQQYAVLIAVAVARAEFYGQLLEEQMFLALDGATGADSDEADERRARGLGGPAGLGGLIGYTGATAVTGPVNSQTVEFVPTGEQVRALVDLEGRERDRAATLIEKAVKMGIKLDAAEALRTYARTTSVALQGVIAELGLSLQDEAVLRAAQRAALAARRAMGQDDGDPDMHVGARMSPAERVAALEGALERARRDQAALTAGQG